MSYCDSKYSVINWNVDFQTSVTRSDENVQVLTTHTTMNLLWIAEGRKSYLIFNRWEQMSVGNIQLAKSIFCSIITLSGESNGSSAKKDAVLALWRNRQANWACAMHLWKDAKPGPSIERQPFWIHSTAGKFEQKSVEFAQWTGKDVVTWRDSRLRTVGQSHSLCRENI